MCSRSMHSPKRPKVEKEQCMYGGSLLDTVLRMHRRSRRVEFGALASNLRQLCKSHYEKQSQKDTRTQPQT